MRIASHSNLTVFHIQHAQYSRHPLAGLGPKSVLALPMSVPVEQVARVGIVVQADCASEDVGRGIDVVAGPSAVAGAEASSEEDSAVPEESTPNTGMALAGGSVGNMLDMFA